MVLLKLYTEDFQRPALQPLNLVPLIHGLIYPPQPPGLGDASLDLWHRKYEPYWQRCREWFALTDSLEEADLVVLPYDWYWVRGPHWRNQADPRFAATVAAVNQGLYQKALDRGKRVVLFFTGDRSHEPVPFPKAWVFREGAYRSQRTGQEFVLPAFAEDLLQAIDRSPGEVALRPYQPVPTLGFCGLAKPVTLKTRVKDMVYHGVMLYRQGRWEVSPHLGEDLRIKALKVAGNSECIKANFIIRTSSVFLGANSPEQRQKSRQDYIDNLLNSDYILCCRGSGNFSFRVYETLSMGRIPVIIDTDSCFPYDFCVDWRRFAVWVSMKELDQLPQKIVEFHGQFSPQEFAQLQHSCRELWQSRLSPIGFFSHFHQHFSHEGLS